MFLYAGSSIQNTSKQFILCINPFFLVNFALHLPHKQKSNAWEKVVGRTVHTRFRQLYLGNHSEIDTLSCNFFLTMTITSTSQNINLFSWIVHIRMRMHVHLCVFMYNSFILERVWISNLEPFTFLRIYILWNNIYFVYDHVLKCRFCLFSTPVCIWMYILKMAEIIDWFLFLL